MSPGAEHESVAGDVQGVLGPAVVEPGLISTTNRIVPADDLELADQPVPVGRLVTRRSA